MMILETGLRSMTEWLKITDRDYRHCQAKINFKTNIKSFIILSEFRFFLGSFQNKSCLVLQRRPHYLQHCLKLVVFSQPKKWRVGLMIRVCMLCQSYGTRWTGESLVNATSGLKNMTSSSAKY